MPIWPAAAGARNGSKPSTFMSSPAARRATSRPMRPRPTTPSVLPASCVPTNLLRCHLAGAERTWASAAGMWRARAMSRVMVCSAVLTRVAAGRVHDDDALAGGGGHVDVVHADAGAGDGPELAGVFEQVGGDRGAAADDDAVGGLERGFQLGALEAVALVEFKAGLAQQVEAGGFQFVADEDAWHEKWRARRRPPGNERNRTPFGHESGEQAQGQGVSWLTNLASGLFYAGRAAIP